MLVNQDQACQALQSLETIQAFRTGPQIRQLAMLGLSGVTLSSVWG